MIVVSDTSPIRALIAIGKADLLNKLFTEIFIPEAVKNELTRIEFLKTEITEFLHQNWVHVRQVSHDVQYHALRKSLDEGESEAIVLALILNANLLLIDESLGRQAAKEKSLRPIGLVGVLLKAKREKHLALVKPELDELINRHGFWIDAELYQAILKETGEG